MITQMRAKSFKSWKDTGDLRLAPLTGLFGPNSSGKTSILQMLLMMKQTVQSPDWKRPLHTGDDQSLIDLGTFFDLIHSHGPEASLYLSFSWNLPTDLFVRNPKKKFEPLFRTSILSFETAIHEESDRAVVDSFRYSFDGNEFGMKRMSPDKPKTRNQYQLIHGRYPVTRYPGRAWPLPPPMKCYGFPSEVIGYYQNVAFLAAFVLRLEQLFNQIAYLGPLREYPKRSYVWAGERPIDVGRKGEHAIAVLLAARAEGLTSGRGEKKARRYKGIEERVLEWMQSMELIHSFSLKPIAKNRKDYEVRVKKSKTSSEVLITDVGFGVSQILPVLALCYYVPEGSTILLEQPEIHLHPSVQAALADVVIDVVKERNVQIIVESHSEHLLRRLQRRIAEEKISHEQTALYFCRMDNGESKIDKLDVDEFGNIRNWPEGFFGDEMGELAAQTEAEMRRTGASGQ